MARSVRQIQAKGELAYGCGETGATIKVGNVTGYLQSASNSTGGDVKTYKDAAGITAAVVIPETWTEATLEVLLLKSGAESKLPQKGDEISNLGKVQLATGDEGGKWRVDSYTVNWQNEDVAKVSISAKTYPF